MRDTSNTPSQQESHVSKEDTIIGLADSQGVVIVANQPEDVANAVLAKIVHHDGRFSAIQL